jgi:rubrerythrin
MFRTVVSSVLSLLVAFVTSNAFAAGSATTLKNLQAAFNGESNANARYVAFAKQADKEGYGQVASLFRAAARAEAIHAANHAVVIKKLGGTPEAKIEKPDVKTTRDNLMAAVKGETYERDQMYPEFLKEARAVANKDAIQTFNYAKSAETEHARLYTEALNKLDSLKGSKSLAYFVCPTCGYTVATMDFAKCPVCFTGKEKYETIS